MIDENEKYIKYVTLSKIPKDAFVENVTLKELLDVIGKMEKRIEQLERFVYEKDKINEKEKCTTRIEKAYGQKETEAELLYRRAKEYETINEIEAIKYYKKAAEKGHSGAMTKCINNGWYFMVKK